MTKNIKSFKIDLRSLFPQTDEQLSMCIEINYYYFDELFFFNNFKRKVRRVIKIMIHVWYSYPAIPKWTRLGFLGGIPLISLSKEQSPLLDQSEIPYRRSNPVSLLCDIRVVAPWSPGRVNEIRRFKKKWRRISVVTTDPFTQKMIHVFNTENISQWSKKKQTFGKNMCFLCKFRSTFCEQWPGQIHHTLA